MFAQTLKRLAASVVVLASIGLTHGAHASVLFEWSYSAITYSPTAGIAFSASGWLLADPEGGGVFDVTAIGGERDGVMITGLASYADDDEKVFTPDADKYGFGAFVDVYGLAYSTADGGAYNVYVILPLEGTNNLYYCGDFTFCEVGPNTAGYPLSVLTSGSFTEVPEPSTWVLMLVGLIGLGFARGGRGVMCRSPLGRVRGCAGLDHLSV